MSVVSLKNISVEFPIFNAARFSFRNTIVNKLGGGFGRQLGDVQIVTALEGVSLEVQKGDRIGLVGHNGSGKSTLLRTIAGIYTPTKGTISIKGEISTLFGLSTSLNEEMTGNENLILGALMYGKTKREAEAALSSMQEFTELGDYLNLPLRTYSEGMKVRIGFAVATTFDPDILLIDEVFGAGDKDFFEKSQARIQDLVKKSNCLFLATHSDDLIQQFCNKAILMEHGQVAYMGNVKSVLKRYHETAPQKEI